MSDELAKQIKALEKELCHLIKPDMSRDEKIRALENSYWRSHNAGYCDHIAGMELSGIENSETEQHDLDCRHKWEVIRLLELLKEG